jgi:hypothetical protein
VRLTRDDVTVEWESIGEGYSGDYDPEDPTDKPLLRFYVTHRNVSPSGLVAWDDVEDASYCTTIPEETPEPVLMQLLQYLLDEFYEPVMAHQSVKKLGERLSWISPDVLLPSPGNQATFKETA